MAVVRRDVEQRVLVWLVAHIQLFGMRIEQLRQFFDVAFARGIEQLAVDRQRVDVRLECAPTSEAVPFGELELSVGELRIGIGSAQLVEAVLRLLAKPLETGRVRQRRCAGRRLVGLFGHKTPSFL